MKTGIGHTRFCYPAMTGLIAVLAVGLAGCAQPKSQAPQPQSTVEVLSRTGTKEVPERPKLKVRQVTGDARYAVRDFPSVRLKPGMNLPEESRVRTGAGGRVDIALPKAQLDLRIMPESTVVVENLETQLEERPRLHLVLEQGRLLAVVRQSYAPGQMEVATGFGRVGILKAGDYDFHDDGRVIVGEGNGRAAIVYVGLSPENIPYIQAGQMFDPATRSTGTTPPGQSADSQKHFQELAKDADSS